ncbi:general secretion pathway protein GspB [Alteromonas sp. Mex14]|nr:general secretion pathway protein GspB [Alteromonas sp. Mex14]
MSNIVAIENLKPGMVIVQITQQNGPVKIRKSGLVTSDAMVQGLSEMGVQEVEIDPEQTVEIAPAATHHRTQTQALLRGEHDTTAKFDKSLNEQFNRSLFLPTVEGLPSAWKLYTKQFGLFAVVILGGLCIGFSAATTERWWPALVSQSISSVDAKSDSKGENNTALATHQQVVSQQGSNRSVESVDGGSTGIEEQSTEQNIEQGNSVNDVASAQTQSGQNNNSANGTVYNQRDTAREDFIAGNNQRGSVNDVSILNNTAQITARAVNNGYEQTPQDGEPQGINSQNYEGKVLNESTSQSDVSVSPELMARFNAAVEALDTKAQDNEQPKESTVTVRDDIPRVDQLPVRLLTRLPSMNFSAHMYASRPADRWVRVNGRQVGEGDWIADRVQIVNIEAQRVVLSFEDELFTMAALTDW